MITSELMHVPEGAGATFNLKSWRTSDGPDGGPLQDAEPVQELTSGGRQRQQRRPTVHSAGAAFRRHRRVVRSCEHYGRGGRASRKRDVLGLMRARQKLFYISITAEVGTIA